MREGTITEVDNVLFEPRKVAAPIRSCASGCYSLSVAVGLCTNATHRTAGHLAIRVHGEASYFGVGARAPFRLQDPDLVISNGGQGWSGVGAIVHADEVLTPYGVLTLATIVGLAHASHRALVERLAPYLSADCWLPSVDMVASQVVQEVVLRLRPETALRR